MSDYIVVGAGFAGCVLAERLAEVYGRDVRIIEQRSHIGGNCYDERDNSGVIVHRYGPHLFHTDSTEVYEYLQGFGEWREYHHKVVASVDDEIVALPFSFKTLYQTFEESKADRLKELLISKYGEGNRVSVLKLREDSDTLLRELGDYIYEKIFVHYTAKQWGIDASQVDPSVLARVPVLTSYDDGYFNDRYQMLPTEGYSKIFQKIIDHPLITVELNRSALEMISIKENQIYLDGEPYGGKLIYTGKIDELFGYTYGKLAYRSLDLQFEVIDKEYYQDFAVVNYPNEHDYTRITEFKHMHPTESDQTTILREYPQDYVSGMNIPYYPMPTDEAHGIYLRYKELADRVSNLILLGRLAEYRYYDMDDIVERALDIYKEL